MLTHVLFGFVIGAGIGVFGAIWWILRKLGT
jgi:hypothetical protein